MIRKRTILAVVGAAALSVPLFFGATATAETTQTDLNPCKVEGWFVNPDEADREPTRTYDGFVFESTDLIHHNAPAGLTTADLESGDFNASPAPDQSSFFSVEVSGDDGGYATLRYNRSSHEWDMVTGGVLYSNADPDKLVEMVTPNKSKKVVRFGVGYTKNPAGTVKTTVTSISFQGKVYTLKCEKPTEPTKSPTATPTGSPTKSPTSSPTATPTGSPTKSPTATPSSTGTTSPTPSKTTNSPIVTPVDPTGNDEELPVTGASVGMLVAGAIGVTALGTLLVIAGRRRKRTS